MTTIAADINYLTKHTKENKLKQNSVFSMTGRCFPGLALLLVCVVWGAWLNHITTAQVGKEKTNYN